MKQATLSIDVPQFQAADADIDALILGREDVPSSSATSRNVWRALQAFIQKLVAGACAGRGLPALVLGVCGLRGPIGARVPLPALATPSLARLEIRGNALGPGGFAAIADALKGNRTLRTLVLHGCLGRADGALCFSFVCVCVSARLRSFVYGCRVGLCRWGLLCEILDSCLTRCYVCCVRH